MSAPRYHRPETLGEAVELLEGAPDARALAGGQLVVPAMYRREMRPGALVDLSGVLGRRVEPQADGLRVSAGATHASVAADPLVAENLPILRAVLQEVADPAVRNGATLGGAVAARERASDIAVLCLGLDAVIETTRAAHPATAWYAPDFQPDQPEIVTAVRFRRPTAAGYARFLDPAARYPRMAVLVAAFDEPGLRVAGSGSLTAGPARWPSLESRLSAPRGPRPVDAREQPQEVAGGYPAALAAALAGVARRLAAAGGDRAASLVHGQILPGRLAPLMATD